MPHIKNALIRYRIIDRCIRNQYKPYPTKRNLREACEEALYGLAEGANICDSTIEKDMFAMKMEHDAPIKYSKRYGGYYYSNQNFSINDIPLTENDIESIQFAVKTLLQFRDVELFKQFGSAIDKIVDRLTIATNPADDEISNFVQFETASISLGNEFLAPILSAIRASKYITFDYTSYVNNKTKERKVIPLLLKEFRNRWYTIVWDSEKQGIITYALERISNFKETEEYGLKPTDFNPSIYFQHAFGITSKHETPSKILFKADKISAKYLQSQPLHHSQQLIKEGKNRITFEIEITLSEEFYREVLSYGQGIEIIEPTSVRNEVISRIKEMNKLYE